MNSPDSWYEISLALGWLVTAAGWFVSTRHANKLETRKEIRSEIDKIISCIDSLLSSALVYYTESDSNQKLLSSLEIRSLIDRLLGQLDCLDGAIYKKIVPLYEAATGGNFESTADTDLGANVEQYKRIVAHAERLRGDIETWYARRYQQRLRRPH